MAEEKFEESPPSEEELRELRERMSQTVDSHALAASMIAEREPQTDAWAAYFAGRVGFDPSKTLTELEGIDVGDGLDMHDEPEVHALRRVPLVLWTPGDIYLTVTYRQGARYGIWLAVNVLESEPMIEAMHYEGDLLLNAAKAVASVDFAQAPSGETAMAGVEAAVHAAEIEIWRAFDDRAEELALDEAGRSRERRRVADGHPIDEYDPFWEAGRSLKTLARARDVLSPSKVLCQAEAEMVYAVYRPRMGLELVRAEDLADPAVMAHLEHPDTFYFRRETRFEIVEDGERVRIRHFSSSAIENWHGIAFADIEAATGFARERFGIALSAWRPTG